MRMKQHSDPILCKKECLFIEEYKLEGPGVHKDEYGTRLENGIEDCSFETLANKYHSLYLHISDDT